NVSKTTPSTKLSELFSGLSTTITSGGNLGEFFAKRADSLLVTYRLEREKYTKIAETFINEGLKEGVVQFVSKNKKRFDGNRKTVKVVSIV
ncbi:MAG: type II secretion system F family protein, partial [Patescibacteria group bacterium]